MITIATTRGRGRNKWPSTVIRLSECQFFMYYSQIEPTNFEEQNGNEGEKTFRSKKKSKLLLPLVPLADLCLALAVEILIEPIDSAPLINAADDGC